MNRLKLAVVTSGLLLLAACGGLPESGSIEVGEAPAGAEEAAGVPFAPRPPQRGEDPTEIVNHFLEAMTANPIELSTARQFLSRSARGSWRPDRRIITYAGAELTGSTTIEVSLTGANWLDSYGSWRGPLPGQQSRITLPLTSEEGEWRIDGVPNAMIVPEQWFLDRFQQVSLFFFDSTAEILVPEPVFVPRGEQLVTSLVQGLLRGPSQAMSGELRSYLPPRSALADVSVPVDNGVAEIALTGDLANLAPDSIDPLAAQIAWTLRQDQSLSAARITIGEAPLTLQRGVSEFTLEEGARFNPAGATSASGVFGLRDGRLTTVFPPEVFATDGAFGAADYSIRDVSVSLDGDDVLGVTADGTTLLGAPVDPEGTGTPTAETLLSGATDLLHPSWDHARRIWLLDRTPSGARLLVSEGGAFRQVRVDGITGESVIDFLVSRDGTRLVAAVDGPDGQQVVVSRLLTGGSGVRATPARGIGADAGGGDIRDLAWRTPIDVAVLSAVNRRLSEVHTISVDGSPATPVGLPASELLRENGARLLSAPDLDLPAWLVTRGGRYVELSPVDDEVAPPRRVVAASYVG